MKKYEITTVVKDEQIDVSMEQIKKIFQEHSIKVEKEENWGSKKLWHPIKKITSATYLYFVCEILPEKISQLKYNFKIEQNILKFLVVKVDGK